MKFRTATIVSGLAICLVAFSQFASAQGEVRGTQGSRTVISRTVPHATESADLVAAAAATFTGKFVFSITITIDSTLPTTDTIGCEADALVDDVNLTTGQSTSNDEVALVAATRSGAKATCTVTIPYSWSLLNSSTDSVELSIAISVPASAQLGTSAGLPARIHTQGLGSIKVPANNTTTTETINATI